MRIPATLVLGALLLAAQPVTIPLRPADRKAWTPWIEKGRSIRAEADWFDHREEVRRNLEGFWEGPERERILAEALVRAGEEDPGGPDEGARSRLEGEATALVRGWELELADELMAEEGLFRLRKVAEGRTAALGAAERLRGNLGRDWNALAIPSTGDLEADLAEWRSLADAVGTAAWRDEKRELEADLRRKVASTRDGLAGLALERFDVAVGEKVATEAAVLDEAWNLVRVRVQGEIMARTRDRAAREAGGSVSGLVPGSGDGWVSGENPGVLLGSAASNLQGLLDASLAAVSLTPSLAFEVPDAVLLASTFESLLPETRAELDRGLAQWALGEERLAAEWKDWSAANGSDRERALSLWSSTFADFDSRRGAWELQFRSRMDEGLRQWLATLESRNLDVERERALLAEMERGELATWRTWFGRLGGELQAGALARDRFEGLRSSWAGLLRENEGRNLLTATGGEASRLAGWFGMASGDAAYSFHQMGTGMEGRFDVLPAGQTKDWVMFNPSEFQTVKTGVIYWPLMFFPAFKEVRRGVISFGKFQILERYLYSSLDTGTPVDLGVTFHYDEARNELSLTADYRETYQIRVYREDVEHLVYGWRDDLTRTFDRSRSGLRTVADGSGVGGQVAGMSDLLFYRDQVASAAAERDRADVLVREARTRLQAALWGEGGVFATNGGFRNAEEWEAERMASRLAEAEAERERAVRAVQRGERKEWSAAELDAAGRTLAEAESNFASSRSAWEGARNVLADFRSGALAAVESRFASLVTSRNLVLEELDLGRTAWEDAARRYRSNGNQAEYEASLATWDALRSRSEATNLLLEEALREREAVLSKQEALLRETAVAGAAATGARRAWSESLDLWELMKCVDYVDPSALRRDASNATAERDALAEELVALRARIASRSGGDFSAETSAFRGAWRSWDGLEAEVRSGRMSSDDARLGAARDLALASADGYRRRIGSEVEAGRVSEREAWSTWALLMDSLLAEAKGTGEAWARAFSLLAEPAEALTIVDRRERSRSQLASWAAEERELLARADRWREREEAFGAKSRADWEARRLRLEEARGAWERRFDDASLQAREEWKARNDQLNEAKIAWVRDLVERNLEARSEEELRRADADRGERIAHALVGVPGAVTVAGREFRSGEEALRESSRLLAEEDSEIRRRFAAAPLPTSVTELGRPRFVSGDELLGEATALLERSEAESRRLRIATLWDRENAAVRNRIGVIEGMDRSSGKRMDDLLLSAGYERKGGFFERLATVSVTLWGDKSELQRIAAYRLLPSVPISWNLRREDLERMDPVTAEVRLAEAARAAEADFQRLLGTDEDYEVEIDAAGRRIRGAPRERLFLEDRPETIFRHMGRIPHFLADTRAAMASRIEAIRSEIAAVWFAWHGQGLDPEGNRRAFEIRSRDLAEEERRLAEAGGLLEDTDMREDEAGHGQMAEIMRTFRRQSVAAGRGELAKNQPVWKRKFWDDTDAEGRLRKDVVPSPDLATVASLAAGVATTVLTAGSMGPVAASALSALVNFGTGSLDSLATGVFFGRSAGEIALEVGKSAAVAAVSWATGAAGGAAVSSLASTGNVAASIGVGMLKGGVQSAVSPLAQAIRWKDGHAVFDDSRATWTEAGAGILAGALQGGLSAGLLAGSIGSAGTGPRLGATSIPSTLPGGTAPGLSVGGRLLLEAAGSWAVDQGVGALKEHWKTGSFEGYDGSGGSLQGSLGRLAASAVDLAFQGSSDGATRFLGSAASLVAEKSAAWAGHALDEAIRRTSWNDFRRQNTLDQMGGLSLSAGVANENGVEQTVFGLRLTGEGLRMGWGNAWRSEDLRLALLREEIAEGAAREERRRQEEELARRRALELAAIPEKNPLRKVAEALAEVETKGVRPDLADPSSQMTETVFQALKAGPRLTVAERTSLWNLLDRGQQEDLAERIRADGGGNQRDNESIDTDERLYWVKGFNPEYENEWKSIRQKTADRMCNLTVMARQLETLGLRSPDHRRQLEDYLNDEINADLQLLKFTDPSIDAAAREVHQTRINLAKKLGVILEVPDGRSFFENPQQVKEYFDELVTTGKNLGLSFRGNHWVNYASHDENGLVINNPFGRFDPHSWYATSLNENEKNFGYKNFYTWKQVLELRIGVGAKSKLQRVRIQTPEDKIFK